MTISTILDVLATAWDTVLPFLMWVPNIMLVYSLSLMAVYLMLYFTAVRPFRQRQSMHSAYQELVTDWHLYRPISLILPAYNEEKVIVDCVRTAMELDYPALEVVVVCDGPKDNTFGVLVDAFNLKDSTVRIRCDLETKPVQRVMTSEEYPKLMVILKANGGKADALNVGINAARSPLVCCCDADTLIEPDALYRLARPFRESPDTIAAAGALNLTNGAKFKNGRLLSNGAPANWLARIQTVEYIRAFYFGRMGFESLGAMLLISGAFGLFDRHAVVAAGGYYHKTQGEDMELVVRLHRHFRAQDRAAKMAYIPDAVAWTEAPEDLKGLRGQRMRWQRGLCETLVRHRGMMLSPKMGAPAFVGYPYFVLYEGLAPLIEFIGYVVTAILAATGALNMQSFGVMLLLAASASLLATFVAIYEQQRTRPMFSSRKDLLLIILAVFQEMLVFRPICLVWRVKAIWQFISKQKVGWGNLTRKGFDTQAKA